MTCKTCMTCTNDYKTADGEAAGWWWLRSPGSALDIASNVYTDDSLYNGYVRNTFGCVRPALWINLEASDY